MENLSRVLLRIVFSVTITTGLSAASLFAQSIDGTTSFCSGQASTYSFTPANGWASAGTMTCVGCDQNTVQADGQSISLVWLPNQTNYYVLLPIKQHVIFFDVFSVIYFNPTAGKPLLICGSETSTSYLATQTQVPMNDGGCSNPPSVFVSFAHDPDAPDFPTKGYPFDTNQGDNNTGMHIELNADRYIEFTAYWKPNWQGSVTITLQFERRTKSSNPFSSCDSRLEDIATFTWTRYSGSPGGSLSGGTDVAPINSNVSLSYVPDPTYAGQVQGIKYFLNGTQIADQSTGCNLDLASAQLASSGPQVFSTQLLDQCGIWHAGPQRTITVNPTCYLDNPLAVSSVITGEGFTQVVSDSNVLLGYEVTEGNPYGILVSGVTDFNNNYTINYGAGQSDMTISSNSFSINQPLGSYQIGFTKNTGREGCPDIPTINVFLGGGDQAHKAVLQQDCPIILPTDFANLGFANISPGDPVLNYFAATVESKSAITILPGITLALGAELILIQDEPTPPHQDTDGSINYVQTTSYDEYNEVLSQQRSYFDQSGRHLQSQSKNISAGIILANATIYDSYGRGAVKTLSAPVTSASITSNGCGTSTKGSTYFSFSPDFSNKGDDSEYSASDFDISNGTVIENTPQSLTNLNPGTLGWYYGSDRSKKEDPLKVSMNEPNVAVTKFPYARTMWHRDGTQELISSTRPGDAFAAGNGHIATTVAQTVDPNDIYLAAYLSVRETELSLAKPTSLDGQFFRTVVTDENGSKSITYTDKGGKTIISLYFGQNASPITTSYQFYDLAGRLIIRVSPKGFEAYNGTNFDQIDKTKYFYNHKGWLIASEESDAGRTEYVYRKDGKIRFSQNADQRKSDGSGRYSYTNYDRLGRPIENGEYQPVNFTFKSSAMNSVVENVSVGGGFPANEGSFSSRVFTFYDSPDDNIPIKRTQRFVQGTVSRTQNENVTTWYSYDEQGRAEWIVQNIVGLGVKILDYRYGSSGAVRQVSYQDDNDADRFNHYYEYDADGRLFKAYITRSKLVYDISGKLTNPEALELQATYFYYAHGPLKRIEYPNKLQGIDYTYTADGSLKGINHFDPNRDPGNDGQANGFRPDVFGITLDYFDNDYASNFFPANSPIGGVNQFGGHIKAARWHSPVQPDDQFGYMYTYDDRYQLTKAEWCKVVAGQLVTDPVGAYQEIVTGYDGNGNINNLHRTGSLGNTIADFAYAYGANTNKLVSITQTGDPTKAIKDYTYNNIGQMVRQNDPAGKQTNIAYDATGKMARITDKDNKPIAENDYDDKGFRLSKTSYDENGKASKTWYVRDASGKTVAIYSSPPEGDQPEVSEFPVYGAGKIGVHRQFARHTGMTFFEIADHLGTVRAVIGDKLTLEYLATMEDERQLEEEDFNNVTPVPTATYINHTPAQITVNDVTTTITDPSKVIRINNGQDNPKKPVGGGIMLWVHPGDVVNAEVFAKYANFDGTNNAAVNGITGYLTTMFFGDKTVIDGVNPFSGVDGAPTGVFSALGNIDDTKPRAFLTYILYDKDMVPQAFDLAQVTDVAAISAVSPETQAHERLHLDNITVQKEGFIYIYVSNLSDQNMDVYFDDLRVTHQLPDVVAGGDYYPFGSEISDRQITREEYRYKFQGQYSEKDDETGWNIFKLRQYDPEIGRWLTTDPKREFASPYIGMSNNPVSRTDQDGGCVTCLLVKNPVTGNYSFNPVAVHLLSVVSGVDKQLIENVVIQERGIGQYRPFYNANEGGGAITLGTLGYRTITYTENFFAMDPKAYNGNGYGGHPGFYDWLDISSHEVGHLPQITREGGLTGYLLEFISQYATSGSHDGAFYEHLADIGQDRYREFNAFVNLNYGKNALYNLFQLKQSDEFKMSRINVWFKAYTESLITRQPVDNESTDK